MKKAFILLPTLLFNSTLLFAQVPPNSLSISSHQLDKNYALPSPEASAIMKTVDLPVDLSTGKPNIEIPKDAQMETFTYNPLVGMTSKCDIANLISFYEYDNLGRLKLVRNQYGKITKKIDYATQQPE